MSKDFIPDFIPDSYLADMSDSDEETERKELAKQLLEFQKIKLIHSIYNAPKVQKSLPLRKVKFKKEIDENEEEEYQQKQKQKQN
jgi:hypothetical protein